jgi:hypothetical protein
MSTPTPTPQNTPSAPFELPCAEFDEPVKAAPESPHTAGVSLPESKRSRRAWPWACFALALPAALALLALLAAAHASRRHHSAPPPKKASVTARSQTDRRRALGHPAHHASLHPIRAKHTPVTHASVAQPAPAVAPASTTPSVPVAPAEGATEPEQHPASRPRGGEEQSGGGPFSP